MFLSLQRQMIVWTLVLVVVLGGVIATMCLQPPTPESAQIASPGYARLQRRRTRLAARAVVAQAQQARADMLDDREPASTGRPAGPAAAVSSVTTRPVSAATGPPASSDVTASFDLLLRCGGVDPTIFEFENEILQIRLSGKLCESREEILSTEIRNTSNGASATIFHPSARSFTTDYMALTIGENKIRVLHQLKNGGREEHTYIFTRQPRRDS